jgi:Uma2 family endonuclease
MLVQAQHRFSVKDYYRMAETGILKWGAHDELLNGVVMDFSSATPFHASVTTRISELFFSLPEKSCIVSVRNPVRMDDYTELQPDVMLLKFLPNYYKTRHPQPEDVFLLIEISDSTLETDQEEKLPAYGRAGIPEVWIVNLNELTIEVYREPNFTGYGSKTILPTGGQAAPNAFPDVIIDVAELLKR